MPTINDPVEAAILARVVAELPDEFWREHARLSESLQRETLSPTEHAELLRLTDVMELHQAERIAALAELAALRGQSLPEVMDSLGIHGPTTHREFGVTRS